MSKERLIVFGSPGVGEVIHHTPLHRCLARDYDLTLVLHEWQEPALRRLPGLPMIVTTATVAEMNIGRTEKGRVLRVSPSLMKRLGIPDARWIAPCAHGGLMSNDNPVEPHRGVDEEVPNGLARNGRGREHATFSEKLCQTYGYAVEAPDDLRFVTTPDWALNGSCRETHCPTIAVVNSAEPLRRLPQHVMESLVKRFTGVRFVFVGYEGEYDASALESCSVESGNVFKSLLSYRLIASMMEEGLMAIHFSDVVVGPDCGWSYVGAATGAKVVILQSRAIYESLVPECHRESVVPFQMVAPMCDRMCDAQRFLEAAAAKGDRMRPIDEWEDKSRMTPEWKERIYNGSYPRSLACYYSLYPDCLDYRAEEIDRLVTVMCNMHPALEAHKVR